MYYYELEGLEGKVQARLKALGVPEERLPDRGNIRSFIEEFVDQDKLSKWIEDYAYFMGYKKELTTFVTRPTHASINPTKKVTVQKKSSSKAKKK